MFNFPFQNKCLPILKKKDNHSISKIVESKSGGDLIPRFWQRLSTSPGFDPLGVTDETFGTVIGPQQVAARLLPGATATHRIVTNKQLHAIPGSRQQHEEPHCTSLHPGRLSEHSSARSDKDRRESLVFG